MNLIIGNNIHLGNILYYYYKKYVIHRQGTFENIIVPFH